MTVQVAGRNILAAVFLGLLFLLPACGGGSDGGLFDGLDPDPKQFYVSSFADNTMYLITASKVAEGTHCYIYLEQGEVVDNAAGVIPTLLREFDNTIYSIVTTRFGSEPNPGSDGDPKIYIVLTTMRQSPNPSSGVAGYFRPANEYSRTRYATSNQKEMFFVDIPQLNRDLAWSLRTLAHEFQHMIHWEQKMHRMGQEDDLWLNEAMSEAAESYCYGVNASNAYVYANNTEDSLTGWSTTQFTDSRDYASVGMWSQYIIDRIPDGGSPDNNVFARALRSTNLGRVSVGDGLAGTGKSFFDVFFDWTLANLFTGVGDPDLLDAIRADNSRRQWSYAPNPDIEYFFRHYLYRSDNAAFQPLPQWSSTYSLYTPVSPPFGDVTWLPTELLTTTASFIDYGNGLLYSEITPATSYPYFSEGYLVVRNATVTDSVGAGDNVVFSAPGGGGLPPAAARLLSTARPAARSKAVAPPVVHDRGNGFAVLAEEERRLRALGIRPEF